METYRVQKDFDSAWVNYHFYKLEDPKYYEKRIIGLNKYTDDEPIFLEVRNIAEDNTDEGWAFKDYFEWKSGSPNAVCMVISDRLKTLLYEQLVLPKHYLYPTEIWNPRTNETRKDYYVMHFVNNVFEEFDFTKSEFAVYEYGTKFLYKYEENVILKSQEDFDDLVRFTFNKTKKDILKPTKLVYKKEFNYDLYRIMSNYIIYTSPKVKQLVIDNNISGIDLVSDDDINVIPEIIINEE